jgi:hypothetical protein
VQASAPFLEDLADETHDEELYEPATVVFNIPMGRSQEVLWVTAWCASPAQFDQNWENISLVMTLDGEEVLLNRFVTLDNPSEEMNCRYYFTALSDWPVGEHVLTTEMTFAIELDDGMQDQLYAPGTRVYEYHVYVGH